MAGIKKELMMLINSICLTCKTPFHTKPSELKVGKGKYCSKTCYGKARSEWMKDKSFNPTYKVDFSLEKNPNWNGGKSFEPYPLGWTRTFKEQIRFRDGYKCQMCSKPEAESKTKLYVHHINYIKTDLSLTNLITLCVNCHAKVHGGNLKREHWKQFFEKGGKIEYVG